jgi:hypothetical protein
MVWVLGWLVMLARSEAAFLASPLIVGRAEGCRDGLGIVSAVDVVGGVFLARVVFEGVLEMAEPGFAIVDEPAFRVIPGF